MTPSSCSAIQPLNSVSATTREYQGASGLEQAGTFRHEKKSRGHGLCRSRRRRERKLSRKSETGQFATASAAGLISGQSGIEEPRDSRAIRQAARCPSHCASDARPKDRGRARRGMCKIDAAAIGGGRTIPVSLRRPKPRRCQLAREPRIRPRAGVPEQGRKRRSGNAAAR